MTKLYKAEKDVDVAIRQVKSAQTSVDNGEKEGDNANKTADNAENQANGAQEQKGGAPTSETANKMGTDAQTSSSAAGQANSTLNDTNTTFNEEGSNIGSKIDENSTKLADWQSEFTDYGQQQNDNLAAAHELLANAGSDAESDFSATYTLKTGAEQQQAQEAAAKKGTSQAEHAPETPESTGRSAEYEEKLQAANAARASAEELGSQIGGVQAENESLQADFDAAYQQAGGQYADVSGTTDKEKTALDKMGDALTKSAAAGGDLSELGTSIADTGSDLTTVGGTVAMTADGIGLVADTLGITGATVAAVGTPLVAVFGLGVPVVGAGGAVTGSSITVGGVCHTVGRAGTGIAALGIGISEIGTDLNNTGVTLKRDSELANAGVKAAQGDWKGAQELFNQYSADADNYRDGTFKPLITNAQGVVDGTRSMFEDVVNIGIDISQGDYESAYKEAWKLQADAFNTASSAAGTVSDVAGIAGDLTGKKGLALASDATELMADGFDFGAHATRYAEGTYYGDSNLQATGLYGMKNTVKQGTKHAERQAAQVGKQDKLQTVKNSVSDLGYGIQNNRLKSNESVYSANDGTTASTGSYTYNGRPDPKPRFTTHNAATYQQRLNEWYERHPEAKPS